MKTAREHPETGDVVFDVRLAIVAIALTLLTFGLPLLLAAIR